jgi:hypothetical protein
VKQRIRVADHQHRIRGATGYFHHRLFGILQEHKREGLEESRPRAKRFLQSLPALVAGAERPACLIYSQYLGSRRLHVARGRPVVYPERAVGMIVVIQRV